MDDFKNEWSLEMALEVVQHKTVDSDLWTDAVKWLFLYGPPGIKELLGQASDVAVHQCFPDLKPAGFTTDGQPCYSIADLATSLGISEEEALEKLAELEDEHGSQQVFDDKRSYKIQ